MNTWLKLEKPLLSFDLKPAFSGIRIGAALSLIDSTYTRFSFGYKSYRGLRCFKSGGDEEGPEESGATSLHDGSKSLGYTLAELFSLGRDATRRPNEMESSTGILFSVNCCFRFVSVHDGNIRWDSVTLVDEEQFAN